MIELNSIALTFSRTTILRDVTLELRPEHRTGLIGESGSGKSTVAKVVLGLLKPTDGTVLWNGKPYAEFSRRDREALRRFVQPVFQDGSNALNPRRPIGASINDGFRLSSSGDGSVTTMLSLVGLDPELAARRPGALSGGQRQRAGIARALATGAPYLILDEPTSALDPTTQDQVLSLLENLSASRGLGYLLISHNIAIVDRLCDHVAVLDRGVVVEQGETSRVIHHHEHALTKKLVDASTALQGAAPKQSRLSAHHFHPERNEKK